MNPDEQGFLYPVVDVSDCIECGLCERICPVLNQNEPRLPKTAYAAKNIDKDVQAKSSSGGVFAILAEKIIEKQGVVFGARFDAEWGVMHDYTESLDGIGVLCGSKYVQSKIGDTYKQCECFLKNGRYVLFCGTPCQIAGLNLYLRKDYDKLLTVDIICHGVPSPKVWHEYIMSVEQMYTSKDKAIDKSNGKLIQDISFRDKRYGWENYGLSIAFSDSDHSRSGMRINDVDNDSFFEPMQNNVFLQGFVKDLYLRPSCYSCPAKSGKSYADITLSDFWGVKLIGKSYYDKMGVSLVMISTDKGQSYWSSCACDKSAVDFKRILQLKLNPSWSRSSMKPKQYDAFWRRFSAEGVCGISSTVENMKPGWLRMIFNIFNDKLRSIRRLFLKITDSFM